jgi:site-specific recombinase XerD
VFSRLFVRSDALTRQLTAPLADERQQYLANCEEQGMSAKTLRRKARILLSVANYLKLAHRPDDQISVQEIGTAAARWSRKKRSSSSKSLDGQFVSEALEWLNFLGRLQMQAKPARAYDHMVVEFREFMEKDRGLSPATIEHHCHSVRPFLDRLLTQHGSLDLIGVADIDSLLAQKVNEHHYARVSVRGYASSLRSFFRYAEMRGWCGGGIAASIMAPRVFRQETLPSGPRWELVQEILDATSGDQPTMIRDHAILMLLAVYGVRSREVARLRLEDIDWHKETIVFTRAKVGGSHSFPLHASVGAAIVRYLKEVRPKSRYREVFLTRHAPVGPLSGGALWNVVGRQLRSRVPSIQHHGPHSLRHACATRLINEGLSLKEIGDHLGQRDPEATRIYAKVDLVRLRQVASFDLGGLL